MWCKLRVQYYYFACIYSVLSTSFVEGTIFSPLYIFGTLVEDWLYICVGLFLDSLLCVSLICLFNYLYKYGLIRFFCFWFDLFACFVLPYFLTLQYTSDVSCIFFFALALESSNSPSSSVFLCVFVFN